MPDSAKTVMIEDANIFFRNFAGREGEYNQEGEKSFLVALSDDVVEAMLEDGWNVKYTRPRDNDEDATPFPFLPVSVRYDIRPPRVVLITEDTRTQLDERSVEVLDWADIKIADLIVRGSYWTVNGKTGIKAYLQSLFVTIEEDALERKYAVKDVQSEE